MKKIITIIGLFCLILQPIVAQNDSTRLLYEAKANLKISEINKSIRLVNSQKNRLKLAYIVYQKKLDSIVTNFSNAKRVSKSRLQSEKTWHNALMNTFTDQQRLTYLTTLAHPRVDSIANAKITLFRNSGDFSESELLQTRKELAAYYTKEQIILLRDQYDVAKRRENQRWLRTLRPKSVKVCDYLEKLQKAGALKDGKIVW